MTWEILDRSVPWFREVHVVPIDDLRKHVVGLDCWCHPTPDVDDRAVIVHHALDRRELFEVGELKPS